ncbi:MAG: HD domain-containing protein [Actinobacteria bacterium]|nr:HD domain-containing protein [Actinomycetota bacterium]
MKTHTTVGAQILSGSTYPLIQLGAIVALNHHERWDGTGYPSALSGANIPRCGRIVTVADVFDALTSERVYKRAWSQEEALDFIISARGHQFEPEVVDAFIAIIVRRHPHLRAVVDAHSTMPARPHS